MLGLPKYIFTLVLLLFSLGLEAQKVKDGKIEIRKYDTNYDGLVDNINLKTSEMHIAGKIKGGRVVHFEIEWEKNGVAVQVQYSLHKNKFEIVYAYATRDRIFLDESKCHSSLKSASDGKSDLEAVLINSQIGEMKFSKSCNESPKLKAQIKIELENILSTDNQESYFHCLNEINSLAAISWLDMPDSLANLKFQCIREASPSGSFDIDKNEVTVSESCVQKPGLTATVLKHEFFHLSGVKDDEIVKCLVDACPSLDLVENCKKKVEKATTIRKSTGRQSLMLIQESNQSSSEMNPEAANAFNYAKEIKVPSEIGAEKIPQLSSTELGISQSRFTSYESISTDSNAPGNSFAAKFLRVARELVTEASAEPNKKIELGSSVLSSSKNSISPIASEKIGSRLPAANSVVKSIDIPPVKQVVEQDHEVGLVSSENSKSGLKKSGKNISLSKSPELNSPASQVGKVSSNTNLASRNIGGSVSPSRSPATVDNQKTELAQGSVKSEQFVNLSREDFMKILMKSDTYDELKKIREKPALARKSDLPDALKKYKVTIKNGFGESFGYESKKDKPGQESKQDGSEVYLDNGRGLVKIKKTRNP